MSAPGSAHEPLVLIVEDEAPVVRFLRATLSSQGYRLIEAVNGTEALRAASQYVPEIVLLDLGLPDMDGLEVVRRLREWFQGPILVVSARGQERDKVHALDAGADDYLTKPFGLPELLARMRVALRHAARAGSATKEGRFGFGDLKVDLEKRRIHLAGVEIKLTPIEFRLLSVLVRNAGKVVTHKQLLTEVWGPTAAEEKQYLRVYMTHLRRKLQRSSGEPSVFETEAGVGYRLRWDPE
jgi:two-component system, OmpR family, KDP operon response regulator KdpE